MPPVQILSGLHINQTPKLGFVLSPTIDWQLQGRGHVLVLSARVQMALLTEEH